MDRNEGSQLFASQDIELSPLHDIFKITYFH